jgi:2-phosphosulfolactate phosphatase
LPFYDQSPYQTRFDWGASGLQALAPGSEVVVIVDVLSFSTAVDIALSRGAVLYPFPYKDERAASFAAGQGAHLAVGRAEMSEASPFSLSPASLQRLRPGDRLVLPSPNGATLSRMAAELGLPVLAGCLRNARAVARAARARGRSISVIAAGERWGDGSLRVALEDLLGAGAILSELEELSPEARAARATFETLVPDLRAHLLHSSSGRELCEAGFEEDVLLAAELNSSLATPSLEEGAFCSRSGLGNLKLD